MKIGIDCAGLLDSQGNKDGGTGRYLFEILKEFSDMGLDSKCVLFCPLRWQCLYVKVLEFWQGQIVWIPPAVLPVYSNHFLRAKIMKAQKLSCIFFPFNSISLGYRGKSVVAVHDLAIFLHPEWFPSGQWFSKKIVFGNTLRKANKVIVFSQNTAADLYRLFKVDSSRVSIISHGVYFDESWQTVKPIKKYIFFVGTIEPRKNLVRAIQAFEMLLARYPKADWALGLEFWLAGKDGWKSGIIWNYIKSCSVADRIRYLGVIKSKEKNKIIAGAQLVYFASLYEGFGLPILEAFGCGVSVITSNVSSMPEVAAGAAITVNPFDPEAIMGGYLKILSDSDFRSCLKLKSRQRLQAFSWRQSAELLWRNLEDSFK